MKTQEFNKHDAVLLMMHLSRIEGFVHAVSDLSEYEHIQKDLSEANHLCLKLISKTSKEYANAELLTAVEETIEDNLDLADGEDCTLIKLKKALECHNKQNYQQTTQFTTPSDAEITEYSDRTGVGHYAARESLQELNNGPVPTGYSSWGDYWKSL